VSYIQAQLSNILQIPDLRDKVQAAGVDIINGDAIKAQAFLNSEYKKWAALIKASGTVIE
jgi:tripartite-type tricarboxylate transporter receptor subunit TctC